MLAVALRLLSTAVDTGKALDMNTLAQHCIPESDLHHQQRPIAAQATINGVMRTFRAPAVGTCVISLAFVVHLTMQVMASCDGSGLGPRGKGV